MQWEALCRNADRLLFLQLMQRRLEQGGRTMSQSAELTTINGVDVHRMGQTVKAIQNHPHVATFQFRAANRWKTGGHNESTIHGFYGAGQEDTARKAPFAIGADEPPVLFGHDHAPNPAEYVLHALAACLTTSLIYHAAARGIRVHSVESRVEGDLDLRGFLG
ncbi:MAG TPA: OsmC family protein, partial [Nitrospira sp.]|nr:OsmC family protein [Nitrospira sp.]